MAIIDLPCCFGGLLCLVAENWPSSVEFQIPTPARLWVDGPRSYEALDFIPIRWTIITILSFGGLLAKFFFIISLVHKINTILLNIIAEQTACANTTIVSCVARICVTWTLCRVIANELAGTLLSRSFFSQKERPKNGIGQWTLVFFECAPP